MTHKHLLSLSLLVAATTTASANPGYDLGRVATWVVDTKENYSYAQGYPAAACPDALAAMRAGKVARSTTKALGEFGAVQVAGSIEWEISLPNAEALCAEAAKLQTATKDYKLFVTIARDLWQLDDISLGQAIADYSIEQSNACDKAVAALSAAGIPDAFPYIVKDRDQKVLANTVGELKPNVCDRNRKAALKFTTTLVEAERAYEAKLTKAGITGEKAEWFKHYNGNLFTAGGREPELAGYGKASVWFAYTYSSDPDITGNHLFSVRRYQFKGSKLVKSSEKTYRRPLSFKNSIGSVMK